MSYNSTYRRAISYNPTSSFPFFLGHLSGPHDSIKKCHLITIWYYMTIIDYTYIWLLVSTHLKKYKSKWESSPNRGANKTYLKPPPSYIGGGGPSCKKFCSPDFCKKNTGLSRLCDLPLPWNMQLQPHPWRVRKGSSRPFVMRVGILGWSLRQAMLQDEGYNPLAPPSGWIEYISPYFNHPKKKTERKLEVFRAWFFLLWKNMFPKSGTYMFPIMA